MIKENKIDMSLFREGDWILWKSDKPENAFPINFRVEEYTNYKQMGIERFDYIPIRKEFLTFNGFDCLVGEESNIRMPFTLDEIYKLETIDNKRVYIFVQGNGQIFYTLEVWDDNSHSRTMVDKLPIKYIHELQQILDLTGVKKEIKLK
jgi:hypothetical protein